MKKFLKFSLFALFAVCVMSAICGEFGMLQDCETLASLSDFIMPTGAGAILAAGPGFAVNGTEEVGDITKGREDGGEKEYLDEDLNKAIVKVRPSDTPLDTLTRELNNSENVKAFETGGWEIGTRDVDDKVKSTSGDPAAIQTIAVKNADMWLPGDIVQIPSKMVTNPDSKKSEPLTLYVTDRGSDGSSIVVRAVNSEDGNVPQISGETTIVRLGSAAAEKQAQAEMYSMNPSKRKNFCQIHMTQVEESIIHGLYKKKVDMDFSVYKEQVIWDFKRAMELTNLFGVKGVTYNKAKEVVYLSDGLWNQLQIQHNYNSKGLTDADWVALTRKIFDGNNGADRRLLLAGPGLLESIASVKSYEKQLEAKNVEIVHGIRVHRIETNFGELLVKNMGSLFSGDRAGYGMVLDMGYITKKIFEPLHVEDLDLSKTGQRRVNAQRIIENYCLFAENLPVHCKLTPGA